MEDDEALEIPGVKQAEADDANSTYKSLRTSFNISQKAHGSKAENAEKNATQKKKLLMTMSVCFLVVVSKKTAKFAFEKYKNESTNVNAMVLIENRTNSACRDRFSGKQHQRSSVLLNVLCNSYFSRSDVRTQNVMERENARTEIRITARRQIAKMQFWGSRELVMQ